MGGSCSIGSISVVSGASVVASSGLAGFAVNRDGRRMLFSGERERCLDCGAPLGLAAVRGPGVSTQAPMTTHFA